MSTVTKFKKVLSLSAVGLFLCAGQALAQDPPLPQFGHVFIVVEENHDYSQVVGNTSMPYLNSLIAQYGLATNYVADTHPSIDNYFMLTVGKFEANNSDSWNCSTTTGVISDDNIVRELVAAGKTWKLYAENLPSTGYTGCDTGGYVKHHNPFAYLNDVANDATQKNNMVNFTNFATDLANGTLPQYVFIVPNNADNSHDGSLATADTWLKTHIDPLVQSAMFKQDGLLIIVYDEGESTTPSPYTGGPVACVMISPKLVSAGFRTATSYHHENVLRLMAEGIGLTTFPNSAATSANMAEFFSTSGPAVSLSPASLSFGNQQVGSASAAQKVTLTNTGSAVLSLTTIAVTGTNSGDFAETNTCGSSVAAGANCSISVTFTPTTTGTRTGSLKITDNASNSPQMVSLTGTGVMGTVSLSPTSLSFGNQQIGSTSGAQKVTLSNNASATLTISSIAIDKDFAETNTCGNSVGAGASCTISVTFSPSVPGDPQREADGD